MRLSRSPAGLESFHTPVAKSRSQALNFRLHFPNPSHSLQAVVVGAPSFQFFDNAAEDTINVHLGDDPLTALEKKGEGDTSKYRPTSEPRTILPAGY